MNVVKMILKRTMLTWSLVLIAFIAISLIALEEVVNMFAVVYPIQLYILSPQALLSFAKYFIIPIACGWIYFSDKRNGYINYIENRVSLKKYKMTLVIICVTMIFLCVFIGERISYYKSLSMFELIDKAPNDSTTRMLFRDLLLNNPYLYSILYGAWQGIVFSTFGLFAVVLSFYVKNFFIIATSGIVYHFIGDLIATKTPFYPIGSMIYSRGFNSFGGEYANEFAIVSGPLIFIIFILLVWFIGAKRARREIT